MKLERINTAKGFYAKKSPRIPELHRNTYSCVFFTKNFSKSTATNRLFLKSQSYHPLHVLN